jgi:hypothetical protein
MGCTLLLVELPGAVVEKKVGPLLLVPPYAWMGGRVDRTVGETDAEVDCG